VPDSKGFLSVWVEDVTLANLHFDRMTGNTACEERQTLEEGRPNTRLSIGPGKDQERELGNRTVVDGNSEKRPGLGRRKLNRIKGWTRGGPERLE
jgi:hypothetical protein